MIALLSFEVVLQDLAGAVPQVDQWFPRWWMRLSPVDEIVKLILH